MTDHISISVEWIEDRLDQLRDRRRALRSEIDRLRHELTQVRVKQSILQEWKKNPPGEARSAAQEADEGEAGNWEQGDIPGPSEAVDRLVDEQPGISTSDIVDAALERGIDSRADDKRGVVRTSIRRRVNSGKLFEDEFGRIWPSERVWAEREQRELIEDADAIERRAEDLDF